MKLDQFDKIETNIKSAVDLIYSLKFENKRLKKEIDELKNKIEELKSSIEIVSSNEVDGSNITSEIYDKNLIVEQLEKVLNKVKNLAEGVDA